MGKFKEETGKSRLGLFLQKVAPDILETVGDLTGVRALDKVAELLEGKGDEELPAADRAKLLQLIYQDRANARKSNVEILTSKFAPPIAKVTPYLIDVAVIVTWVSFTFYIAAKLIGIIKDGNSTEVLMALYLAVSDKANTILNYHRGSSSTPEERSGAN